MGIPRFQIASEKKWESKNEKKIGNSQSTLKKTSIFWGENSQIQGRTEFKNWEFQYLLYPYFYKKYNLFWEFPQEEMSKYFGNPMSSLGGAIIFWNSPFSFIFNLMFIRSKCVRGLSPICKRMCPLHCHLLFVSVASVVVYFSFKVQ